MSYISNNRSNTLKINALCLVFAVAHFLPLNEITAQTDTLGKGKVELKIVNEKINN